MSKNAYLIKIFGSLKKSNIFCLADRKQDNILINEGEKRVVKM